VIENINFTNGAGVVVLHNNVIIRNCRINGTVSVGSEGGIRSGVVVQDCEFVGTDTGGLGGGISLYRYYVHGLRDSDFWRNPSNCTWESNYFEDILATSTTPHIDMVQWYWSRPADRITQVNFTVRGNRWNIRTDYQFENQVNAILFNDQAVTNITWEYNWMKSGGYVIRTDNVSNVQFNNNIWEDWGWGPILTHGGYSNIGFAGNQVWRNGTLQQFDKPPGANSDLWANS